MPLRTEELDQYIIVMVRVVFNCGADFVANLYGQPFVGQADV